MLKIGLDRELHCVVGRVVASYCLEKLKTYCPSAQCKFSEALCLKQRCCCENLKSCVVSECLFQWRGYLFRIRSVIYWEAKARLQAVVP